MVENTTRVVHRIVDFAVSGRRQGDAVCGASNGTLTFMPSSYDCPDCLSLTPGLQLLGYLEVALENIEELPVRGDVKASLLAAKRLLYAEDSDG